MQRTVSRWPNNERLAVLVTIMFEVWSEGKAPPYSPMTTALKPGTPDLLGIPWSQYGGKTGIWRFMRILDDVDIKATVCLNAKGAEVFPEAVKELYRRGHEIAGQVDAIAFTNRIQSRHLFRVAEDLGLAGALTAALGGDVIVAAVGPVCAEALHSLGVVPDVIPARPNMQAMIGALAEYVELTEGLI